MAPGGKIQGQYSPAGGKAGKADHEIPPLGDHYNWWKDPQSTSWWYRVAATNQWFEYDGGNDPNAYPEVKEEQAKWGDGDSVLNRPTKGKHKGKGKDKDGEKGKGKGSAPGKGKDPPDGGKGLKGAAPQKGKAPGVQNDPKNKGGGKGKPPSPFKGMSVAHLPPPPKVEQGTMDDLDDWGDRPGDAMDLDVFHGGLKRGRESQQDLTKKKKRASSDPGMRGLYANLYSNVFSSLEAKGAALGGYKRTDTKLVQFDPLQFSKGVGYIPVGEEDREITIRNIQGNDTKSIATMMSMHIIWMLNKDRDQLDSKASDLYIVSNIGKIAKMVAYLNDLHKADFEDQRGHTASRIMNRAEMAIYTLICRETGTKEWFTEAEYNRMNLRKRRLRGTRWIQDQTQCGWISNTHYTDLLGKLIADGFEEFNKTMSEHRDKGPKTPKELISYEKAYKEKSSTLIDSGDEGNVVPYKRLHKKSLPWEDFLKEPKILESLEQFKEYVSQLGTDGNIGFGDIIGERVNVFLEMSKEPLKFPDMSQESCSYEQMLQNSCFDIMNGILEVETLVEKGIETGNNMCNFGTSASGEEVRTSFMAAWRSYIAEKHSLKDNEDPRRIRINPSSYLRDMRHNPNEAETDKEKWSKGSAKDDPNHSVYYFDLIMETLKNQGIDEAEERYGSDLFESLRDVDRIMYPGREVVPVLPDENVPKDGPLAALHPEEYPHDAWIPDGKGGFKLETDGSKHRRWCIPKGMRFISLMEKDTINDIDVAKMKHEGSTEYGYPNPARKKEQPTTFAYLEPGEGEQLRWQTNAISISAETDLTLLTRCNRKSDMLMQFMRKPIKLPRKDDPNGDNPIIAFSPCEGLAADGSLMRSVMAYTDVRLAMHHYRGAFTHTINGEVVVFLLTAYLENKTKKATYDAGHTCRVSTRSPLSFIVGIGFVDCAFGTDMIPETTLGMSFRIPESLSFTVSCGSRSNVYINDFKKAFMSIVRSQDDPQPDITEKMGVVCMENMQHVYQDPKSRKQGNDYSAGAVFYAKPEKYLIEGAAWYFLTREVAEDLKKLMYKLFPANDQFSRHWRLKIVGSMLSLHTNFTTGGYCNMLDQELYEKSRTDSWDYPGFTQETMPSAEQLYFKAKCPLKSAGAARGSKPS